MLSAGEEPLGDSKAQIQSDPVRQLKGADRVSIAKGQEGVQAIGAVA